jgi:putative heme-binding domain-containing protein
VFENFVPPSQRRKRLGLNIRPEDILAIEGQAARGKLIYTSDSSRCRTCHIPNSEGQRPLGPELKRIASKKYPPAEMLRQILEPSLKMDPEYTPYLLVTVSGEVHVGLLIEKTDAEVVIRDARQELIRVPADQVASFEKQTTSIMPDKLLSDLTAQEAADLLAFLVALQSDGEPGTRR